MTINYMIFVILFFYEYEYDKFFILVINSSLKRRNKSNRKNFNIFDNNFN